MVNISFPNFTDKVDEDAADFLDNLKIACVISRRDDNVSLLRIFSLLMKVEAKSWYNALPQPTKEEWELLRAAFMRRFGEGNS